MMYPLGGTDLEHFADRMEHLAPSLRHRHIFLTGGTGFFGAWLVECFLHFNQRNGLHASLTVLSREPRAFLDRFPHLERDPSLSVLQGDVRSFLFPASRYDYVIHAATDSVVVPGQPQVDEYATIVEGSSRVLEFARASAAERLLFVSSGAVYGPQPRSMLRVEEEAPFQPGGGAYAEGKRAAERLFLGAVDPHLVCVVARPFAFVGAHLPLRAHFAAGNFMADALDGKTLSIQGDGTPLRSYLYAADLAIWLWTLLLRGRSATAYNVGSEEAVSIRELAERTVAAVNPRLKFAVLGQPGDPALPPARYVPSTRKAREELGLEALIGLDEALRRSAAWYRRQHRIAKLRK